MVGRLRVRATNGDPLCIRVDDEWQLRDVIEIDRAQDIGGVPPGQFLLQVEFGGATIGRISVPIQAEKTSVFRIDKGG